MIQFLIPSLVSLAFVTFGVLIGRALERHRCLTIVKSELEYPTPWPLDRQAQLKTEIESVPTGLQEFARGIVEDTKESIAKRIITEP